MIESAEFIEAGLQRGFSFYSTVPCSYFQPLLDSVTEDSRLIHVGAVNEGDAVAIATGAALGGRRSVVMMQNSGLGNAVSPLTSLNAAFELPVLLVVTWRAEPGVSDEPQHRLMGGITPSLLDLMEIPWELFPSETAQIQQVLSRALREMRTRRRPYALVMRKGSIAPFKRARLAPKLPCRSSVSELDQPVGPVRTPDRISLLRTIVDSTPLGDSVVVATTGYTGRELCMVEDRANHFYMVGSMGCALPLGLGMAITLPNKQVIVLDGDGSLLMRQGAMATVGHCAPANLVHILLDNGVHLSTGGQPTVSGSVDFCGSAVAAGYRRVYSGNSTAFLKQVLATDRSNGPTFLRAKVTSRSVDNLPRPKVSPGEVASRLQQHINGR